MSNPKSSPAGAVKPPSGNVFDDPSVRTKRLMTTKFPDGSIWELRELENGTKIQTILPQGEQSQAQDWVNLLQSQ